MKNLYLKSNLEVELVFNNYPNSIRNKMLNLRELIIETANEVDDITKLEETIKWREPSYLTKNGSPIKIDWKINEPNQYTIYFPSANKLIKTFKMIFKNTFEFKGKKAIVFQIEDEIPKEELKDCVKAALTYHKVKHLPTLGI